MSELSWGFQLVVLFCICLRVWSWVMYVWFPPGVYIMDAHVYRYSSGTVFIYMGFNKNQLRTS
jgi:hypothetical protein